MNPKAQISIEFLIVIILLVGVLLFSLAVFSEKNHGLILSQENYEAKLIADQIAEKANLNHYQLPASDKNCLTIW